MNTEIRKAAEAIAKAGQVVALTGAGISVESGIPPFRGKGGIWEKYFLSEMIVESRDGLSLIFSESASGYQRFASDESRIEEGSVLVLTETVNSGYIWELIQ